MGILGPPYCGIGATIRIGRDMLCLPYEGFFLFEKVKSFLRDNFFYGGSSYSTWQACKVSKCCYFLLRSNAELHHHWSLNRCSQNTHLSYPYNASLVLKNEEKREEKKQHEQGKSKCLLWINVLYWLSGAFMWGE